MASLVKAWATGKLCYSTEPSSCQGRECIRTVAGGFEVWGVGLTFAARFASVDRLLAVQEPLWLVGSSSWSCGLVDPCTAIGPRIISSGVRVTVGRDGSRWVSDTGWFPTHVHHQSAKALTSSAPLNAGDCWQATIPHFEKMLEVPGLTPYKGHALSTVGSDLAAPFDVASHPGCRSERSSTLNPSYPFPA